MSARRAQNLLFQHSIVCNIVLLQHSVCLLTAFWLGPGPCLECESDTCLLAGLQELGETEMVCQTLGRRWPTPFTFPV